MSNSEDEYLYIFNYSRKLVLKRKLTQISLIFNNDQLYILFLRFIYLNSPNRLCRDHTKFVWIFIVVLQK